MAQSVPSVVYWNNEPHMVVIEESEAREGRVIHHVLIDGTEFFLQRNSEEQINIHALLEELYGPEEHVKKTETVEETVVGENDSVLFVEENPIKPSIDLSFSHPKISAHTRRLLDKQDTMDVIVRVDNTFRRLHTNKEDIASLINNASITSVETEQKIKLSSWNIDAINASSVWNQSTGSGVKVAILDSGINGNISGGYSAVGGSYNDSFGHGTAVAAVLLSVAPSASLYAVKITESGEGNLSAALDGLQWAIDNNMSIIVMSFGFDFYSPAFRDLVDEAWGKDILLVAAAGNTHGYVAFPARYASVIAVGAVNEEFDHLFFSAIGPDLELVAPGINIDQDNNSGTSMAAPHVAGVAALIKEYNATLSNVEVRAKLQHDARDLGDIGRDMEYGHGLVMAGLSHWNFTYTNYTYFYNVSNITNGTEIPWIAGIGTLDDVPFEPGEYRINTSYYEFNLTVTSGGIFTLAFPRNEWLDDFGDTTGEEGEEDDGKIWKGDSLTFQYDDTGTNADVVCYDYEYDGSFTFSECWAQSHSASVDCLEFYDDPQVEAYGDFCAENPSKCHDTGLTSAHNIPSSIRNAEGEYELAIIAFYDCDGIDPSKDVDEDPFPYYVFDQKETNCVGTTQYDVEGAYLGGDVDLDRYTCASGTQCDTDLDDVEVSTRTYDFTDPDDPLHPCVTYCGNGVCDTDESTATCEADCPSEEPSTDLIIVDVIPIQVIPNVNLAKNKDGFVIVQVLNNGTVAAGGTVNVTVGGIPLNESVHTTAGFSIKSNISIYKSIPVNVTANYTFFYKPTTTGVNEIKAQVKTT